LLDPDALRVPFARVAGELVRPSDMPAAAVATCPGCGGVLRLRMSEFVQRHFAHVVATPTCRLVGEGWLHFWTKLVVQEAVLRHVSGVERLDLVQPCSSCAKPLPATPLPASVDDAEVEVVDPKSGRRVDVGLLRGGVLLAAVEVCATNPVDARKAAELSVPWFEVVAGSSALQNGVLQISRSGSARRCAACKAANIQPSPVRPPPVHIRVTRKEREARALVHQASTLRVRYEVVYLPGRDALSFEVACPKVKQRWVNVMSACKRCPFLLQSFEETLRVRGYRPGSFDGPRAIRCGFSRGLRQEDVPELERFFKSTLRFMTQEPFIPQADTWDEDERLDMDSDGQLIEDDD